MGIGVKEFLGKKKKKIMLNLMYLCHGDLFARWVFFFFYNISVDEFILI